MSFFTENLRPTYSPKQQERVEYSREKKAKIPHFFKLKSMKEFISFDQIS